MSNQAMYRRLQRVANRQGGQFASLGSYGAERAIEALPGASPRELMEEMIEEQRRALAAELLRAEVSPDLALYQIAEQANAAAAIIYPDLPAEAEEVSGAPTNHP